MSLTAVEEAGKRMRVVFLFALQDFGNEVKDGWSHIFFVHHVKACDQIGVLSSLHYGINHLNDVRLANDLEAGNYQSQVKVSWIDVILSSDLVHNTLDNLKFLLQLDRLTVFIEE